MNAKATKNSSPSQLAELDRNGDGAGQAQSFDWGALVPLFVHPAKVAIIEAMLWVQAPLSATELGKLFGDQPTFYVGTLSYHLLNLKEAGIIRPTHTRKIRGATERFYFLVDPRPGCK